MSKLLLVSFLLFFVFGSSRGSCPAFISCESSEKQNSCPEGKFYREKAKVQGCCPGCVSLAGEGVSCKVHADCQPGLKCELSKCAKDPSQACEHYKRVDDIWRKKKFWTPDCLPDGSYAPKQCKGEKMTGKCFCVNRKGERIFGEEEWHKAENMTCACSRLVEDMEARGLNTGLHCDRVGNFEPFQCDGGACWCADPATGIPYTPMLPAEMMISLPCHDRDAVGAQYHRLCDSSRHLARLAESLLSNHGTTRITLPIQKCNFDGGYDRVQRVKEKNRCVYINNYPLTEAVKEKGNCNCAYDRHVAQLSQLEFSADCLPRGDYNKRQIWNGKVYCVDGDGFHYSDDPEDCPLATSASALHPILADGDLLGNGSLLT